MKPEEQRIAIAEACGWKVILKKDGILLGLYRPNETKSICSSNTRRGLAGFTPDYLNDLNAIHEAEQTLIDQGFQDRWLDELVEVVVGANVHWSDYHCFPQVNRATATQRAEAFLKTIGKWE